MPHSIPSQIRTSAHGREGDRGDLLLLTALQNVLYAGSHLRRRVRADHMNDEVAMQVSAAGHGCDIILQWTFKMELV